MAILEAAAVGLPLILRDLEEYKEPLAPNYIAGTEENFVEKVKLLAEDKNLREEYSQRAKYIAEKYNIERTTEEAVKIYQSLLEIQ